MKPSTPSLFVICTVLSLPGPALAEITGATGLVAEGAALEKAASGFSFTEGPASATDGSVYFTDQPNNRIYRWTVDGNVELFFDEAGRANGLFVDDDGNVLACADERGEIWRIDPDGGREIILSRVEGKQLNGPNDLWLAPDGTIYFTDPYYQRDYWSRTRPEFDRQNVFFLPLGGKPIVADDRLVKPNGIIGSADGKTLYVADYGGDRIYAYSISGDGSLTNRREFARTGSDGMTLDSRGNLYITGEGVTIFAKDGTRLGHIAVPEDWTANVTFGGPDQDVLFIAATTSVYTLKMQVQGTRW